MNACGKVDVDGGPLPLLRLHGHAAVVPAYHGMTDRQAQPHPLFRTPLLGGIVGIENERQLVFRDAFSRILHGNLDVRTLPEGQSVRNRDPDVPDPDLEDPPSGIASTALTARFRMTWLNCLSSASRAHRSES